VKRLTHAEPRPAAIEPATYTYLPVLPLRAGESSSNASEATMWPGCPFTWACPSQRAAKVMRAIFAGQIAYVPSRRAFAAGIADDDAVDEAQDETEALLAAALDERRARLNAWLNGPDDARYEAVAS